MLNLWRLKLLRDLANLGTMTAVAEAAQLTRPAVSQHLAQLEREVGFGLIERTPRGVRLTDAGVRLAAHARELLAHVESIEADLAHAHEQAIGPLRIAAFGSFAVTVAPAAMRRLTREYPGLEPTFIELEPTEAVQALLAQKVDLAVIDNLVSAHSAGPSLEYVPLMEDRFFVALATEHPLASHSRSESAAPIHLRELSQERWVINESAAAYHGFIMNACWEAGFTPNIVCGCQSSSAAVSFVRGGWAVAVIPGLTAMSSGEGVLFRPVEPAMSRGISVAIPRGSTLRPSISAALQVLREEARQLAVSK